MLSRQNLGPHPRPKVQAGLLVSIVLGINCILANIRFTLLAYYYIRLRLYSCLMKRIALLVTA